MSEPELLDTRQTSVGGATELLLEIAPERRNRMTPSRLSRTRHNGMGVSAGAMTTQHAGRPSVERSVPTIDAVDRVLRGGGQPDTAREGPPLGWVFGITTRSRF